MKRKIEISNSKDEKRKNEMLVFCPMTQDKIDFYECVGCTYRVNDDVESVECNYGE